MNKFINYKKQNIEYQFYIQEDTLKIYIYLKDKNLRNKFIKNKKDKLCLSMNHKNLIHSIFKKIGIKEKLKKIWEYDCFELYNARYQYVVYNYKINYLIQYNKKFIEAIKTLENKNNITLLTECLKQSNKFYKDRLLNLLNKTLEKNVIDEDFFKELVSIKRPNFKNVNNEIEGISDIPVYHNYFKINNNFYYI